MPITSIKSGFSLAEILLGVALAAVVVLTLVALSLTALKGNRKAGDQTLAQTLAHQQLEREIYQAQQDTTAAFWGADSDANPLSQNDLTVGTQTFRAALYVSEASTSEAPNLKRCRLRMSWWGGEKGRPGYGRLSTEIVRYACKP